MVSKNQSSENTEDISAIAEMENSLLLQENLKMKDKIIRIKKLIQKDKNRNINKTL